MIEIKEDLKQELDRKVILYNQVDFIAEDPISIPHQFSTKEDIEISGFLTALIAWGRRPNILKSANKLMALMDHQPYEFLMNSTDYDLKRFQDFIYRTFQGVDSLFYVSRLREIYKNGASLEDLFTRGFQENHSIKEAIQSFRTHFLDTPHLKRNEKHLANPSSGSAAKRINMYLRWMVRQDKSGVDFGIWKNIDAAALICPLDVHSARVARAYGLLSRKQNDWKAAEDLTKSLRLMDANDPCKYDYALFGSGVNNQI